LEVVSTAAEAVRFQVEQARRRRQALLALKDEVADTRSLKSPSSLRQLQQRHAEAGLTLDLWAPGVDVARIDANTFAISIRGFNDRLADKVLVFVDGRTVYTPRTSGVYWDQANVPLEDIDRIEVIRDPAGRVSRGGHGRVYLEARPAS